ncbi:DASH complex subunit Dam1 [Colletotrichum tofieldiae]|nr:DASH complex subunit Dam1 [Colletotrichum tofieldiae]
MADHDNDPSDKRSASRTRNSRPTTPMRPTTPLRPSSRSSFRESARDSVHGGGESFPLNTFEPAFAELSDAVADLEANMMHFQLMHESLARFSESFASFLYGLNMNAFCVDFQEDPMSKFTLTGSFSRALLRSLSGVQSNRKSLLQTRGQDHGRLVRREPTRVLQAGPKIQDPYHQRFPRSGPGHPRHYNAGSCRRSRKHRDTKRPG